MPRLLLAVTARFVPAATPAEARRSADPRILILGGGFGGVAAARRLEQRFARDPSVEVTLVSDSNYLLFTPLLAEVASRALEPQHISAPRRAACGAHVYGAPTVERIDLAERLVSIRPAPGAAVESLGYDHLRARARLHTHLQQSPRPREHAFALKSLGDAEHPSQPRARLL